MKDLSIIIVSFNTRELTLDAIKSVVKNTKGIFYEILVVDNASTDGSVPALTKLASDNKNVKLVLNKENLGFGAGNNLGMELAKARYVLLLNSDTRIDSNILGKMVVWMDKNLKVGVASCRLADELGNIQPNGGNFPDLFRVLLWATFLDDIPGVSFLFGSLHLSPNIPFTNNIYKRIHEQDWVSGAFFFIRGEVVKEVGFFDENIFMYGEEVEYCYRINKAGWKVFYIPTVGITHFGYSSSGGKVVKFIKASVGKESGIIGEFQGLKYFYKKHFPSWEYPVLVFLLKVASLARIIVFGILGRQSEARKIYAKAFSTV